MKRKLRAQKRAGGNVKEGSVLGVKQVVLLAPKWKLTTRWEVWAALIIITSSSPFRFCLSLAAMPEGRR
jgi:hypothetical protein